MVESTLVYYDSTTDVEVIVEQLHKNQPSLDSCDVDIVKPAMAKEGEVWSPQLPEYRQWVAEKAEDGTVKKSPSGRKSDLFSAGVLWMDEFDELLATTAQTAQRENTCQSVAHIEEGLQGAIGLRETPEGYVLTAFDLRRFARALDKKEDLIVQLPAFVEGIPVVRIATEAFARRLVQGIGVRLLIIPDTIESVAAHAFAAVSVQRLHVGQGVITLGEQRCDLAGVSPRLARRRYSVSAHNNHYASHEGSLLSRDGKELHFFAAPYDERVSLPDSVEKVSRCAFAQGCEPPSVVDCGQNLTRVEDTYWDDAVWRCPEKASAYHSLKRRGVRFAGPQSIEQEGCWYDFDNQGAVLVAGPPAPASISRRFSQAAAKRAADAVSTSALAVESTLHQKSKTPGVVAEAATQAANVPLESSVLVLPREVAGQPLVRIENRALPFAPNTLVIPETVVEIGRDNACRGTNHLVLSEGLLSIGTHCFWSRTLEGPVPIPISVRSIGAGSFEYAVCRFEKSGSIVHISADQLLSCFLTDGKEGVPFDFERYDELLLSGKNLPDRLGALLHRIVDRYKVSEDTRSACVAQLREREKETLQRVAREGSQPLVAALVLAGFINEDTFDRQIELLRVCNRADCVAYLMQWKQSQRASTQESSLGMLGNRFSL